MGKGVEVREADAGEVEDRGLGVSWVGSVGVVCAGALVTGACVSI